jgi:hypothetical protein
VGTDLGFTRDRQSISPKSAEADLGGFPQKMRAHYLRVSFGFDEGMLREIPIVRQIPGPHIRQRRSNIRGRLSGAHGLQRGSTLVRNGAMAFSGEAENGWP